MAQPGSVTPNIRGLVFDAVVTGLVSATQFDSLALAGFGDSFFNGWGVYVVRKATGTAAAPQGEQQTVAAYLSTSGTGGGGRITHPAFTVPLAIGDEVYLLHPSIAAILGSQATRADRTRFSKRFYSAFQEEVAVPAVAADQSLPSVVVAGIPVGAAVTRAIATMIPRVIENVPAGANKLSGAQNIQVRLGGGAWVSCIALPDDLFSLAGSTREGGSPMFGQTDVSAVVTGNGTYLFQWAQALADVATLNFNDVQMMLDVEWSV